MDEYIVPDAIGEPITSWRAWFVVPENGKDGPPRLKSFVYTQLWDLGKAQKARCRNRWSKTEPGRHRHTPDEECTCGIYGLKDKSDLDKYYHSKDAWCSAVLWHEIWRVRGEVAMWGRIIPGEKGYRAEYAYPTRIEVPMQIKGREQFLSAKEVAVALEHYGCEVEITKDVIDLR